MELHRLWHLIWQRKILLAVLVVVALGAGYEATPRISLYKANSVIFVGVAEYNPTGVFSNDIQAGQQQAAATFATMVPSITVAQGAVTATGAPRAPSGVLGELSASVVPGTSLIVVSVTDRDPVVAMNLANAASNEFVNEMLKIDPITATFNGATSSPRSPVSLYEAARLPSVPISNGLSRNLVLSGIFGLLAGVALILLLDYLDVTVRSPNELERRIGLPVLGIIPYYAQLSDSSYVVTGRSAGSEELSSELQR
jgi:capsular polysaccharide biosynthesis protein